MAPRSLSAIAATLCAWGALYQAELRAPSLRTTRGGIRTRDLPLSCETHTGSRLSQKCALSS